MSKKIIISSLLFVGLLFTQAPLKAQTQDPLPELPKAGFTPESPFYFLDKLGETLREFFTFNPEGRARLQIKFAAERLAEIQVVFEKKGIEAKGIEVAQNRLFAHLANASTILATQQSKGENVDQLAEELNNNLDASKNSLKNIFGEQKQTLKARENSLKTQLRAARKANNVAEEEALAAELGQVKTQLELIDLKKEDIESEIEDKEGNIEEAMTAKAGAESKIRKAERKKEEAMREAQKEGVKLPANAFNEFDALLSQAKAALGSENFVEAKRFAEQAKDSLETIEKRINELEDALEAKKEAQEALEDVEEQAKEEDERKEETAKKELDKKQEKQSNERDEIDKEDGESEENGASSIEAPRVIIVSMRSGRFDDNVVNIRRGDTVRWINRDSQLHWPASNDHPIHTNLPGFDALKPLNQGESYEFTFSQSGVFGYHDHLNPSITGQVIVK